jgi:hypothetical protein
LDRLEQKRGPPPEWQELSLLVPGYLGKWHS